MGKKSKKPTRRNRDNKGGRRKAARSNHNHHPPRQEPAQPTISSAPTMTTAPPGTLTFEDGSPLPGSLTNKPIPVVYGIGRSNKEEEFLLTCDIELQCSNDDGSTARLPIKYDDAVAAASVSPTGKVALVITQDPAGIQVIPHTTDGTIPTEWKGAVPNRMGMQLTRCKSPPPPTTTTKSPSAGGGGAGNNGNDNGGGGGSSSSFSGGPPFDTSGLEPLVQVPRGSTVKAMVSSSNDLVVKDGSGNVLGVIKSEDLIAAASPTGKVSVTFKEDGTLQVGPTDQCTPTTTLPTQEYGNGALSMPEEEDDNSCSPRTKADRLIKRFRELKLLSNDNVCNHNTNANTDNSIDRQRVELLIQYLGVLTDNLIKPPDDSNATVVPKEDLKFMKSIIKTPNEILWTKVLATHIWSYVALKSSAWPIEETTLAYEEGIRLVQSVSPEERSWKFGTTMSIDQMAVEMQKKLDDLRWVMITILRADGTTPECLPMVGGYHCDFCGATATTSATQAASNPNKINNNREAAPAAPAMIGCCGRCQLTFYCSRECQKKDQTNHKKVCRKRGEFRSGDWVVVAPLSVEERNHLQKEGFVRYRSVNKNGEPGDIVSIHVQLVAPVTGAAAAAAAAAAEVESKNGGEAKVGQKGFWMVSDGRSKRIILPTKCFKPIRPALWGIPMSSQSQFY